MLHELAQLKQMNFVLNHLVVEDGDSELPELVSLEH